MREFTKFHVLLLISILLLGGCTNEVVNERKQADSNDQQILTDLEVDGKDVVTINGEILKKEDLAFYILMEKIKIELSRAEDKSNLKGEEQKDKIVYWDEQLAQYNNINIGLQRMIELYTMALLAEEKNYFVPDEKLEAKVGDFEKQSAKNEAVEKLIEAYGIRDYEYNLKEYIRQSTLRDRVAEDLKKEIESEDPNITDLERNYLLGERFEELYVDQIASLEVKIHLK